MYQVNYTNDRDIIVTDKTETDNFCFTDSITKELLVK